MTCIAATAMLLGHPYLGARDPVRPVPLQDFRYGVRVEMVSVFATVQDGKGRLVTNLSAADFVVYDNGVQQRISQFSREYMPLSVVILLDASSSMLGDKLDNARKSLSQFLNRLRRGDEAMLMVFEARPIMVQGFTSDLDRIRRSLGRLRGSGSTALYDSILKGLKDSEQAHNRRRVLLLLSDGINTYGRAELAGTIEELRRSPVELFAIGLETNLAEEIASRAVTREILEKLTVSAGGEAFIVDRPKELGRICDLISDRMHHQYTFAYYPPKTRNGEWREIRIETKIPGFRIIPSKTGYYPGSGESR